jgi:hypothetical protein
MRFICPDKIWTAQSLTQVGGTHRNSIIIAAQKIKEQEIQEVNHNKHKFLTMLLKKHVRIK